MVPSLPARWPLWTPLGILFCVGLLFSSATDNAFTLDSGYFLNDRRVVDQEFGEIFATDYWNRRENATGDRGLYRPLTLSALALLRSRTDAEDLQDGRSPPIQAVNVFLHGLAAALRYVLILLLLGARPRARMCALIGALAGAVHPVVSEAVGTPVGISETMGMAFVTASLLGLLLWHEKHRLAFLFLHVGFLVLALLSKENTAAVVIAGPLLLWLTRGATMRATLRSALPGVVVLGLWLGLRWSVIGSLGAVGDPVHAGFSPSARIASALAVLFSYDLPALFVPGTHLPNVTFSDVAPASGLGDLRAILGGLVLLIWGALTAFAWRKDRVAAWGLLFFGAALFPVTNLVIPIGAIAATRFLYLPLLGLGVALACLVAHLLSNPRGWARGIGWAIGVWAVPVMAVFGVLETSHWKDQESLFRSAVERSPSPVALRCLAVELRGSGRLEESLELMERAANTALVEIPGSEYVAENDLEIAFMSSMDAARARMQHAKDPQGAIPFAVRADAVALRGLTQAAAGFSRTDWRTHRTAALGLRGTVELAAAEKITDPTERSRTVSAARAHFEAALELTPGDFRIRLQKINEHRVLGQNSAYGAAFRQLLDDSRAAWSHDQGALEVATAYAAALERQGRTVDASRLRTEAFVAGASFVDPIGLFNLGRLAAASRDPTTRSRARKLLELYLENAPREQARARGEARRLLLTLPR